MSEDEEKLPVTTSGDNAALRRWRPKRRYVDAINPAVGALYSLILIALFSDRDIPQWALVAMGALALAQTTFAVCVVTRTAVMASPTHVTVSSAFRTQRVPWEEVTGQQPRDGAMDIAYVIACRDGRRINLPHTTPPGLIDGWRTSLAAPGPDASAAGGHA